MTIDSIQDYPIERLVSHIHEWDRVTGGGLVPGELVLLTGDPGVGKSTLLLQIADKLAEHHRVYYFSSEESLEQVKLRARRIGLDTTQLLFSDEANLESILELSQEQKPALLIIDSLQNCYLNSCTSSHGSINYLKEATFKLMRFAKEHTITVIITGHVTKEGVVAGPKTLEHMVDAVFYLQGEDRWQTRILRGVKNRFGAIDELGFFTMHEQGMHQAPDINQHVLHELTHSPGSALVSFIEGSRPLLLELQALVLSSKYGIPQRIISGIDQTQVILIAAILEKYLQIKLSAQDLFFKVSGGLSGAVKIKTSGTDMGIALALLSSYFQKPLPHKALALGEINLTGQIKPVNKSMCHIKEAEKFGITTLLLAHNQKTDSSCTIHYFKTVHDLLSIFD